MNALTSLRFVAALQVLVFHLQAFGAWPVPALFRGVLDSGYVAVSFFFVLSGFILTWTHATRAPLQQWRRYALQRFARIYPLYAFALLLTLPGWLHFRGESGFVVKSLAVPLLVQAWVPGWAMAWNPPAWSLSVEALFYVLFPFLLPVVVRARVSRVWVVAIVGWLLGLALAIAYVAAQPDGPVSVGHDAQAFWLNALKFHPLVRLPEFLIGMALARSLQTGAVPKWFGALGLAAAVGVVLVLMASPLIPFALMHNGLLTPLFVIIIAACARPEVPVLQHRWLVTLGEASYALYILQTAGMALTSGVARRVWPSLLQQPWLLGAIMISVCVVGSLLGWRLIEVPARNRLLRSP